MIVHTIAARVHGRYLVEAAAEPAGLLVGFHGQSETAATELEHLRGIRGDRPWTLVSVQALNRYYTRRGDIVAAWMTREDRELAIADNISYVSDVIDEVTRAIGQRPPRVVYCGFSQGTAMAYRIAALSGRPADGLIILAGDVPPDVLPVAATLPAVLIGRGAAEEWYTAEKAALDIERLRSAGVSVIEHVFEAGHVRDRSFTDRAGRFIDEIRPAGRWAGSAWPYPSVA